MREINFVTGEFYHIFNRGVDKREIVSDLHDVNRFLQSMIEFNNVDGVGSIYENSFRQKNEIKKQRNNLVDFVAYCINPNHYHFILRQKTENGISQFMKKLGGYSGYYNLRHKRSGSLFQGPFKAVHIDSNEYLLHLSVYVNLNFHKHKLGYRVAKFVKSSWGEYTNESIDGFCKKDIILKQFKNKKEYKDFSEDIFESILEKSGEEKNLQDLLLE